MELSSEELARVLAIVAQHGTLVEARGFLKERDLPHSAGSWKEMVEDRLAPYFRDGAIDANELTELMRASEEYGSQRIFLYRCSGGKARLLLERKRVLPLLEKMKVDSAAEKPLIIDQPAKPTVVDVRWSHGIRGEILIFKYVETRTLRRLKNEERVDGDLVQTWATQPYRAVNVIRLHEDGLLEIAIQSHRNSSKYDEDHNQAWRICRPLLEQQDFKPVSLVVAKTELWKRRAELADEVVFHSSELRNGVGTSLRASMSTQSEERSLFDDPGASRSLDDFLDHDAHCDYQSLSFVSRGDAGELPTKGIRVLLPPRYNEAGITVHASQTDHEHVLGRVLSFV